MVTISNPTINKVFNDLDQFRDFCRFEGHVFNEKNLYRGDARVWQAFTKWKNWKKAVARGKAKR
jgi:hypothetical protein